MLDHSLPNLAKLIDEKTYELRLMWQGASNNNIQRDDLYEDLHWLLMISGKYVSNKYIFYFVAMNSSSINVTFSQGTSSPLTKTNL